MGVDVRIGGAEIYVLSFPRILALVAYPVEGYAYFSKAMAAQISRLKNPHTSLHTYAKNVPEATRKKIYTASNGQ